MDYILALDRLRLSKGFDEEQGPEYVAFLPLDGHLEVLDSADDENVCSDHWPVSGTIWPAGSELQTGAVEGWRERLTWLVRDAVVG